MSKSSVKRSTAQQQWRTAVSTRAFTVMVGLGIVVLGVALTKEIIRKIQIHQQIEALESEIAGLEAHNSELNQMIQYFNSSSFQEKEARIKNPQRIQKKRGDRRLSFCNPFVAEDRDLPLRKLP